MNTRTDLRPGDIGEIIRLHGVLYAQEYGWDHTFEAYVADSLSKFALQHDPRFERIWIVEDADEIFGCVGIVGAGTNTAQLRWFLLAPAARGRGIGKRLVADAIQFSRKVGYETVFLWTVEGLDAATHIYEAAGFMLTEERRGVHWGAEVNEQRFDLILK